MVVCTEKVLHYVYTSKIVN